MHVRSIILGAVFVTASANAFAQEANNLAAVEVPAGTGIYYTSGFAPGSQSPASLGRQAQALADVNTAPSPSSSLSGVRSQDARR